MAALKSARDRSNPYSSVPKNRTLPFETVKAPLDDLLVAISNRIDNDCPRRVFAVQGLKVLLFLHIKVAANTYHTIRYFCADSPSDPFRKLEYALSAPPLIRALVDQVFALAFISGDLETRLELFYNAGW